MLIVHVNVKVKDEYVKEFITATQENARKSLMEQGVARFDVLQSIEDPSCFVLTEVYRTDDDPARHKETDHYKTWRSLVEDMMAEPRHSNRYRNVFPADET